MEYQKLFRNCRVIYLCAQAGFGKTTTTLASLSAAGRQYTCLTIKEDALPMDLAATKTALVVLDDEQCLENEQRQQELVQLILHAPVRKRFLILSRREPMPYWKPLELTGMLIKRTQEDLRFSVDDVRELMCRMGLDCAVAPELCRHTAGYAAALRFCLTRMRQGEELGAALFQNTRADLYDWLDVCVMRAIPQEQRRFLYGVAPYESFTVDMARVLTGDPDIVQIMEELRTRGNFIRREPSGAYCIFPPLFHDYLIERRTRLWTQEERCSNDENAGLYYELNGDFTNALACYELAHSVERIAHLLIRNAENNPGNAHFLQTERYYRALPEDIVLASPALMSAMCMLCSSCYQPQESERWLDALEAFCHNADNSRKDRAFASSKLWYLRIALPHRGTGGIQKLLLSAAGMMKAHELVLQKFSVTGAIPSIMNGGKDFAFWSRHDRLLYQTFRGVVERVLQKDGIGLAQIALGESLFMKNGAENPGEIVMLFHTGICNAEASGSIETTFAGVGLFVRLMVAQGQIEAAMQYLEAFSARITDPSQNMIMGNLCALQTRIALWMGETARAVRWAQKEVSEEAEGHFHITCRYRMLVKARCHLAVGEAQKALSILAVLREYAIRYTRPQVQLETDALLAICMHRMRDERWREYLQSALALSRKYGFVQYLAEEGTALLPLLQEIQFKPTTDFDARLLADVAEYARVYPNYMQGENGLQALRNVDITILRYLCKGMRNEEIAEAMHLSANTVKTYLKNIYATLGVHSRVEAVQIAQRLWR